MFLFGIKKKKMASAFQYYVLTYCYDLQDGKGRIVIEEEKTLVLKEDEPTDDPTDNPGDDKDSGCKKDVSMVIISLISLSSLLVLIRKRK